MICHVWGDVLRYAPASAVATQDEEGAVAQPLLGMRTGAVARDLLILSSGVSRVSKEPVLSLSKEAGGRETPAGMSCFVMRPP